MPPNAQKKRERARGPRQNPTGEDSGPAIAPHDGPGSTSGDRGRTGSVVGPSGSVRSSSRPRSQARDTSQTPRRDPARNPSPPRTLSRNVDFGGGAYNIYSQVPQNMMVRPAFSKAGKPATIQVNSHIVEQWPTRDVFQYDITIGNGVEKRGLIRAVWESPPVQNLLGEGFIFDGNRIGWAAREMRPVDFKVDMDAVKGRQPPPPDEQKRPDNNHIVKIRCTKKVRLEAVRAYLDGRASFDTSVLEGINFLDHLLRETPSKRLINLRRSYFARTAEKTERTMLGGGVEAMKGVYQSLRMAEGKRLVVNVDVSNSCFWHETSFDMLAFQLSGENNQTTFLAHARVNPDGSEGKIVPALRRLTKNQFYVKHRGSNEQKTWICKRIHNKNAKQHKFEVTVKETGKKVTMSVFEYFVKRYNVTLVRWELPLIETNKKDVFYPMEVAIMKSGQRYPYKLNELQTSNMIKFAVSRPPIRRQAIQHGLDILNWADDPMLKTYGMKINPQMLKTNARVLDPPEPLFAKKVTARPGFSGRWDLRGKVFFSPNTEQLKSWGICVLKPSEDRRPPVTRDQVEAFKKNFINLYRGHGGQVLNTEPVIVSGIANDAEAINATFQQAGNQARWRPQMIMVILTNKSAEVYNRVKKSCDCRFGVMSQCVQASNVVKNQPQYCSNVLMKFNCKLGGTTSIIKARKPYFTESTMIIGADVSHAAPGMVDQASMAAMTVSLDKTCSRYGAAVQSNGIRVEMITSTNVNDMLYPLVDWWIKNVGGGHPPKHLYYFRDGVSEGQYGPLLRQEVADIKKVMDKFGQGAPGNRPKMTVVVAEKRHHIRFFPPMGPFADKNGNPLPGTIVEKDVTHPIENDIYLCSHVAIQGTARPTHYHMLLDEANISPENFQTMLYENCYQYQRATTPVSLFPAVYYAHLASNRAVSHIDVAQLDLIRINREKRQGKAQVKGMSDESNTEVPKLLPFEYTNKIHLGMWYI